MSSGQTGSSQSASRLPCGHGLPMLIGEKCIACELLVLRKVEQAAREVDARLSEDMPWKFDGERISDEAAMDLLILHDCLNDVERLRRGEF